MFAKYGSELAAVVVEPLPGNNGLLEQRPEWLRTVRKLCTDNGALLVFDEVISGFRLKFGGYGDLMGVPADIITLGKIIGGGMPVGALMGSRELMENLAPIGGVYQAGTLSGNPVSLAAGIATLKLLEDGTVYQRLEKLGQVLDDALTAKRAQYSWLRWHRVGSLFWFHLVDKEIPCDANSIDPAAISRLDSMHGLLLERGIYLPPSAYELCFLSASHTESSINSLVDAIADIGGDL